MRMGMGAAAGDHNHHDEGQTLHLPEFTMRIVSIDYYMAPPVPGVDVCFSPSEGSAVDQVPVVRIFGGTPAGQKACLHLHRVRWQRAWVWDRGGGDACDFTPVMCSFRGMPVGKKACLHLHRVRGWDWGGAKGAEWQWERQLWRHTTGYQETCLHLHRLR